MFVQPPTTRFPSREMASVADLSAVRADFVAWLHGAGVDEDRVDDLSVVISELGANAVRETPAGGSPSTIEAAIDGATITVEVSNQVSMASVFPSEHEWDLNDPLRTGGRGLMLVSAFVDEVDIDVVGDRLVVRCTAPL